MVKDYSESMLDGHNALDKADALLRHGNYEEVKEEMKKVIVAAREVVAWANDKLDKEHMKNAI